MRVLRTIGFDRVWARAEGQYLFDREGNRYLDLLGGFGMFNAGRNNPRIRAALVEALELETPGSAPIVVTLLPGLLAEELLRRTPARLARVLFTNSGTEATEAALKLGRCATGRSRVLATEQGFHGLTLGSLSASGDPHFTERFGPLLPGFDYVPVGALLMSERVYDGVFDSLEHSVSHGSTFAPNDLAMAAGLATLRELDDAQLVEQSARLGEYLLERTRPLLDRFEVVRDVRGLGLLWAMEFAEPQSGSLAWRVMERVQAGLAAPLVVVP